MFESANQSLPNSQKSTTHHPTSPHKTLTNIQSKLLRSKAKLPSTSCAHPVPKCLIIRSGPFRVHWIQIPRIFLNSSLQSRHQHPSLWNSRHLPNTLPIQVPLLHNDLITRLQLDLHINNLLHPHYHTTPPNQYIPVDLLKNTLSLLFSLFFTISTFLSCAVERKVPLVRSPVHSPTAKSFHEFSVQRLRKAISKTRETLQLCRHCFRTESKDIDLPLCT